MLSTRSKESIKTALAMTIAYGIALSMGWDRPYWAGFAVAFISLSTIGQSLNKGAMRMLGTLVALVVSLAIIALFAQERWGFMIALSAVVGYSTYRMGGSRQPYFWFVVGFCTAVICFDGGTNSAYAFETAVLRAQETGLGILVYTLVTTLLWPTNSRRDFQAASTELAAAQHALYTLGTEVIDGKAKLAQTHAASARQTAAHSAFTQALQAATIDTYEVWELRQQWQRYQRTTAEVMDTLERWRESLADAVQLDLPRLLPHFGQITAEIDHRLSSVDQMLAGQAAATQPQEIDLDFDREQVQRLSHFNKAAFAVALRRIRRLDDLTRDLFHCASDIGGFEALPAAAPRAASNSPAPSLTTWLPDPDSLTAAVRVMAGLWVAYLIYIYVEVPAGSAFVTVAAPFGMIVATTPRMRVTALLAPVMLAITFATLLYVFVMPQLSGFAQLGTLIFLATFTICYLFAAPAQAIGRAFGLAMFVTIAGISNDQSYNFLTPANTALMIPMVVLVLAFVAWFPRSSQPEKVYLRLLRRFFRSSEYLMNTLYRRDLRDAGDAGSDTDISAKAARQARHLRPWRTAFHQRELITLPAKLDAWGAVVGKDLLPDGSAQPLQTLNTRLHALSLRLRELLEAGTDPQADLLVRELLTDVRAWRLKVQAVIGELSTDPSYTSASQLNEALTEQLRRFDQRIRETLNKAADGELSDRDAQNFYRLLGAYRGVSDALINFTADAAPIDWPRWRENRF